MKKMKKPGAIMCILAIITGLLSSTPVMAYDVTTAKADRDSANNYIKAAKDAYYSTASNKYTTMITNLTSASAIVPYRTDLYHLTANCYLGQIMPFSNYGDKLLNLYDKILQIQPRDKKALFMTAWINHYKLENLNIGVGYTKSNYVAPYIERLKSVDSDLAARLVDLLNYSEQQWVDPVTGKINTGKITPTTLTPDEITAYQAKGNKVCIYTLGNALNANGSCSPDMIGRLDKTVEIANQLPDSKIIVSGGNPKVGTDEGTEMKKYLIKQGIDENRIMEESHAKTTIDNTLYSLQQIDKAGCKDVILITADYHCRRGLYCAKSMIAYKGYDFSLKGIASPFNKDADPLSWVYMSGPPCYFDYDIIFN
jgi:hypothetical protein